jgi:hypothetical protein
MLFILLIFVIPFTFVILFMFVILSYSFCVCFLFRIFVVYFVYSVFSILLCFVSPFVLSLSYFCTSLPPTLPPDLKAIAVNISYHIISYRIISYHIIYHIISYHILHITFGFIPDKSQNLCPESLWEKPNHPAAKKVTGTFCRE